MFRFCFLNCLPEFTHLSRLLVKGVISSKGSKEKLKGNNAIFALPWLVYKSHPFESFLVARCTITDTLHSHEGKVMKRKLTLESRPLRSSHLWRKLITLWMQSLLSDVAPLHTARGDKNVSTRLHPRLG